MIEEEGNMAIKQLSVYLENRPGTLAETIRIISDAGINIRALSLADTTEFGILRLITEDVEKTAELISPNTIVKTTDVVAAKMDDRAGGLRSILDILDRAGVNIEYMYAFTAPGDSAYAVFRVDNCARAEEYLAASGVVTLKGNDLHEMLDVQA